MENKTNSQEIYDRLTESLDVDSLLVIAMTKPKTSNENDNFQLNFKTLGAESPEFISQIAVLMFQYEDIKNVVLAATDAYIKISENSELQQLIKNNIKIL